MRDLLALRCVFGAAALFGAALLVLWLLVSQGVTAVIVPPPETEAEQFLRALKAQRYAAARNQLAQDLREQTRVEDLQAAVRALEQARGGIADARGEQSHEQGESARATAKVRLGDRQQEALEFALKKEHGLWRITSLDPLTRLARPPGGS